MYNLYLGYNIQFPCRFLAIQPASSTSSASKPAGRRIDVSQSSVWLLQVYYSAD